MPLAALLALMTGCSTVRTEDSTVGHLAKNTIVIRNHTQYTLTVFRNGVVWIIPRKQGRDVYQMPGEVMPRQELVFYNVTTRQSECIDLMIQEMNTGKGCLRVTRIVGVHHFTIHAATNSPPIVVTVRSRWGYSGS
jgi:hypothetical protein